MYTMPSCSLSLLSLLLASMCLWATRLVQVSEGAGRAPLHQTSYPQNLSPYRHLGRLPSAEQKKGFGLQGKAVGIGFQNNDEFRIKGGYTNVPHLS